MPCVNYPDYHPNRPGAARGGRALDITPVRLGSLTSLVRSVRTPPGYVPLTHAEWEEWRYPPRFDWALLDERTATASWLAAPRCSTAPSASASAC